MEAKDLERLVSELKKSKFLNVDMPIGDLLQQPEVLRIMEGHSQDVLVFNNNFFFIVKPVPPSPPLA
jgi:hypothetical protein